MDDDAGGLVENQQVTILVEDGERAILGLRDGWLGRWNGDLQALSALEAERRAPGPAVHQHPAGLEQTLDARPTELRETGGHGAVEALTPEGRSGGEPVNLARRWCLAPL
jgi:hypothetical protein